MTAKPQETEHVKLFWWLSGATDFIKWAGAEMVSWPSEQQQIHGRKIYLHPSPKEYYAIRFRNENTNIIRWYIQNDKQYTYDSARWIHFWLPKPTSDEIHALQRVGCDVDITDAKGEASFNVDTREQIRAVQDIILKRYKPTLSVTRP